MYSSTQNATHAYTNVGLETGVVAANPHQLILMLYDGAELAVRMAIRHTESGDMMQKSAAITKATLIISEGLRAAIDFSQGGNIAQQLDALYVYMNQQLMQGHINNQTEPLEEVLALLRELHGAWKQIGKTGAAAHLSHSIAA